MEIILNDIEIHNLPSHTHKVNEIIDYSELLSQYELEFFPASYYWQVGEIKATQGWILHLSVIKSQLLELLQLIIPELISYKIPFKIVRNSDIAGHAIAGNLGSVLLAKMVSIYPIDNQQASVLAKHLIKLTYSFKGPKIPTDFNLGSIVYTRYGSFNPVLGNNDRGEIINYIYDNKGKLIPDPYTIPFEIPKGINWPFLEITDYDLQKQRKILNGKYFPIDILKPDVKGRVIKALYFKSFWQIKSCLIKEGKQNMFTDEAGRNIQDRLKWQFDLYQALSKDIPMPRVFDYFNEHGDSYLVMEFINGISLTTWISIAFHNKSWINLSRSSRLQLLDPLLKIIAIIQRLHERGYIHRDITPENFLIDGKEKLYLIDMELAWSWHTKRPTPPYKLGTPGFMSPEQANWQTPTVKEDIYGIGGLMIVFFTNLLPVKFSTFSSKILADNIFFFTGEKKVSQLIANCLQDDPHQRPEIHHILAILQQYKQDLVSQHEENGNASSHICPSKESIESIINAGINGLTLPALISEQYHWLSKIQRKETSIGNEQMEMDFYPGWHTGMSGPLYFLAKAKKEGFNITKCMSSYTSSWEFIQTQFFPNPTAFPIGLFKGGGGIAIALTEGLSSEILSPDETTNDLLKHCFIYTPEKLDLASGWAGQGLALLKCTPWIKEEDLKILLSPCIENIISSQQKDGSWLVTNSEIKGDISFGLDHGVAGIVWFLLTYLEINKDNRVENTAKKALQWIIQKANKKQKGYKWHISIKRKLFDEWSCNSGMPGIILTLIKGYEVLQNPSYKVIAENSLRQMQRYPVLLDSSLSSGLAGLGEVYLSAYKTFNNEEWKIRSDWIASFFCQTFYAVDEEKGCWYVSNSTIITADLYTGYTGVLHFLIHYLNPGGNLHPLSTVTKNISHKNYIKT